MMSNDREIQLCEPAPFLYFENGQMAVTDGSFVLPSIIVTSPQLRSAGAEASMARSG